MSISFLSIQGWLEKVWGVVLGGQESSSPIYHLPGDIGHLFVIVAFVSALLAFVSYYISSRSSSVEDTTSWRMLGRGAFIVHGLSILGVMGTLFYIINANLFEYHYAWQHSSRSLPAYYQISSFWEGQEGSFLLWAFWHSVLGVILFLTARKWESSVMTVLSLIQVFIVSMILGVYVAGYKLGSSPFILLKTAMSDAPIFQMNPNYIPQDGTGLNPVLQNYWMVIHPPMLFLGFAMGAIPFCYAIGALWKKKFKQWVVPALPWVLGAILFLGTGIGMGAAWAYEALSFGGYWAWDPVENASLVPWLIFIAGLHTMLAYKYSGHALRTSFAFNILAFLLILYATFLTRSGILGDTSVHSFTDLGLSGQLVIYLLAFFVLGMGLLIYNWRRMPKADHEENIYSREFWMFIGALVLLLSAVQITFFTSIPVINALINTDMAPPTDPIEHYNKWQLPFSVIVAILTAAIQFFRYKKTSFLSFAQYISVPFLASIGLTILCMALMEIFVWNYVLFLFAGLFAVTGNLYYIIRVLAGKIKLAGASISHIGFGVLIVGVLFSSAKQQIITTNQTIDYGKGYDTKENRQNLLLYENAPQQRGPYRMTYLGDTTTTHYTYYKVRYEKIDQQTGKVVDRFTLYPYMQEGPGKQRVASPDTRHFLWKDIFTHVTSVPKEKSSSQRSEHQFKTYQLSKGDTVFLSNGFLILQGIDPTPQRAAYKPREGDVAAGAQLRVANLDTSFRAQPIYLIRDSRESTIPDTIAAMNLQVKFTKIRPDKEQFTIGVREQKGKNSFIILKAIIFPFINFVWLGIILMIAGVTISFVRRYKEKQRAGE